VTAGRARRVGARLLVFALAVGGFALLGHLLIRSLCRIQPPAVTVPAGVPVLEPGLRRLGRSYVVERGALLEVHLQGTPATACFAWRCSTWHSCAIASSTS
jgi:hypothetical protein